MIWTEDTRPSSRDLLLEALRATPAATLTELGKAVGLSSKSAVWNQLESMKRNGEIRRTLCTSCRGVVWKVAE